MTGATDPENRGTYPTNGGDQQLAASYRELATARDTVPVLRKGDLRFLLTDAPSRAIVFARTEPGALAITAVNPGSAGIALDVPFAQPIDGRTPIRDGIRFRDVLGGPDVTSADGRLHIVLPPLGGALLVPVPGQLLVAPDAPADLSAARSDGGAALGWSPQVGAISYTVWRSPVAGGGYVLAGTTSATTFMDRAAPAPALHYVIRAIDAVGNVSAASADVVIAAEPSSVPSAGPGAPAEPVLLEPLLAIGAILLVLVVLLGAGIAFSIRRRRSSGVRR
jgi:hypothetical protein